MPGREYQRSQIENLRPWVELETGMKFSDERFSRLWSAVETVLGKQSDKVPARLDLILTNPRQRSWLLERLTAELTIGESFFFRNKHHFQALREHVFPAILKNNHDQKEIRIWSAGCAGGEEPYSVAILLDQMLNGSSIADCQRPIESNQPSQIGKRQANVSTYRVHVFATDLNPQFLEKARQGRYRDWSFRQTEIHKSTNYFSVEGKEYCLVPHIRQQVRFACLNLVKDVYPSPLTGTLGLDLILFRNVAIYLKAEVFTAIIQRFYRALRPGGWLLLGETEVGSAPDEGFDVQRFGGATLFRKKSDRGPVSDDALPMPTPPLAAILLREAAPTALNPSLPDWVPLPDAAKATPPMETTLPADQIHRCLQQRNFADAQRTIDRISSRTDRATARLHYVRGLLACAEIPLAREMLDRCLDEEPLLIEAQLLQATFAEEDGDLAQAGRAYRRALYVDRKCTIAHFHLALLQKQTGDLSGARRSLEIAVELSRGNDVHEPVPYGDGVCHGRLQEMAEAMLNVD